MAGPIARLPIADVQAYLGDSIKRLQEIGAGGQMLQLALSMNEYLKDAERWAHVEQNTVTWNGYEPRNDAEFRNWIDQQIRR